MFTLSSLTCCFAANYKYATSCPISQHAAATVSPDESRDESTSSSSIPVALFSSDCPKFVDLTVKGTILRWDVPLEIPIVFPHITGRRLHVYSHVAVSGNHCIFLMDAISDSVVSISPRCCLGRLGVSRKYVGVDDVGYVCLSLTPYSWRVSVCGSDAVGNPFTTFSSLMSPNLVLQVGEPRWDGSRGLQAVDRSVVGLGSEPFCSRDGTIFIAGRK